ANKITFIYSDTDELIDLEKFDKEYKSNLPNAEFVLEPGKGHYASADENIMSPKLEEILNDLNSQNIINLTVIRHAQSEHNKSGVYAGKFDADLSETGKSKAEAMAKEFKGDFDVIIA